MTPGPLLVLVCAVLAMRHARHLSIYAVVWVSYVPAMVTGTSIAGWTARALRRDRPAVLVGLLTLACVGTTLAVSRQFWRLDVPTMPSHAPMMYPAGAVDYLRRHAFRGNVMTPFTQGAYVSWHLYPDVKVSMDARYEAAYPPGAFEESLAFYAGAAGWDTVLQRYDTDLVLAPMIARVTADLARAPGWVQIYGDASFALFARADVPNLPPVRRDDSTPVTTFP